MAKNVSKYEGFWKSNEEPNLPVPVAHKRARANKKEFLARLFKLQGKAQAKHYKGYSHCRLCDKWNNGTREFIYKGWTWPEGFYHYVDVHNVDPSLEFFDFVMGNKPKKDVADVGAISDAIAAYAKKHRRSKKILPADFALLVVTKIMPKFAKEFAQNEASDPEFWISMLTKLARDHYYPEK